VAAADFLVEIGTEELPPKALRSLMTSFAENLSAGLSEARLDFGDVHAYASPRRLTVLVEALADAQPDRRVSQKGPPVKVAFDDDGQAKPPAIAFAKKCGVDVEKLGRTTTDKGEWLCFDTLDEGKPTAALIADIVEHALRGLPIPRRMRWGAGEVEFVRPVHWVVMLHGKHVVDVDVMGIRAGKLTQGHRFHSDGDIAISAPSKYLDILEKKGRVVADFERRRGLIELGVAAAAADVDGTIVEGETLYDEVTALVEWPVALLGSFEEAFLELPREVVISTLTGHQRYFPVADKDGQLLPRFVTVANLESREPGRVRDGNERVIRPRLADAAFFWDNDRKIALAERQSALEHIVYQRGLGSMKDKTERTATLAASLCDALGIDASAAARAAALCKCDLVTGMVGEFPELQGVMGRYYANADGEPAAVADAIAEHYLPRYAGDELPPSPAGQVLAIADKLDTLAGIFALGKKPSGNRDPFGLRRAALGVIRISVECGLDVDLKAMISSAVKAQPSDCDADTIAADVYAFITDRLRRYFLDRDRALDTETFDAVLARSPSSLVDFDRRLEAVQAFLALDAASSLAAANKRIANILRKSGVRAADRVDKALLSDDAEKALNSALAELSATVRPLLDDGRYTESLAALAGLKGPVDTFFDEVMVMADDEALRNNRLALLGEVRELFLDVADISRLAIA